MAKADAQQQGLEALEALYREWAVVEPAMVQAIPLAGGDRRYFRLGDGKRTAIGVYSRDVAENKAFLSFSRHFHARDIPVPEIYVENGAQTAYLQQDLGDTSLLQRLDALRKLEPGPGKFPEAAVTLYQKALEELARMQIVGGAGLDYRLCIPRSDFDMQSIRWDLNYFKYYFLRAVKVPHDEQALEEDFERLAEWLMETDCTHFLYRDFQARNIMVVGDAPYFIDYQGGRRGALQYDVASLLYQAKADLPDALRESLLDHYIDAAGQYMAVDRAAFKAHYRGYVLIRTLQVLGSYGFRGFFERRPHFLDSIPYALDNVRSLLEADVLPVKLPALWKALKGALESEVLAGIGRKPVAEKPLRLRIKSFSYKSGVPLDPSGNGGGFIFDCRAILNPGRIEDYKSQTGRDKAVIDYLEALPETQAFFSDASALVEAAVRRYLERGFTDLMVCFGCTGGQHRSVYFADRLAREIGSRFPVDIEVEHVIQEQKQWKN
jgi:aminoglycoside/choline kinase family phosphotransferase